jgi:uncharacterized protein (TIGR02611 family)
MKFLRRLCIALVGGTVLLIGIVMIVLPAPAILVIPAGLAILAIEFVWARQLLHKIRQLTSEKKKVPPLGTTVATKETDPSTTAFRRTSK